MTPVAGEVTDRYKQGFILFVRFGQRRWIPGVPLDRIANVHEQIGAGRLL